MAGIQYSTAWTDATDAFAFPIAHAHEAGYAPSKHRPPRLFPPPSGRDSANRRWPAAAKKAAGGEPVHTAYAREALRHRCDAEEEPMSDLAARFVYSPLLSTPFKVVCLFCVLGLVLSAAIVPMIAPEYLAWVLSHIE
jgi:hypothetical protein